MAIPTNGFTLESHFERRSANRFHHEVKLVSPVEVDAELVNWLKDAYVLSK